MEYYIAETYIISIPSLKPYLHRIRIWLYNIDTTSIKLLSVYSYLMMYFSVIWKHAYSTSNKRDLT